MPDPFKKAQAGEPVTFSATAWNAMLDAARSQRDGQFDRLSDDPGQFRQATIVRVLNETGRDLTWRSVVGLAGPIFTPSQSVEAFLREVTFRGVLPTADHAGRFAILLEPAADGRIARAFVDGVCQVRLNVADEDHTCAEVQAGNTTSLVTIDDGSAMVLWKESDEEGYGSGTGEQWAIVHFGATCGGEDGATAAQRQRCDCPEATSDYLVNVECGECGGGYYGSPTSMPAYMWVTINNDGPYSGGIGYGEGYGYPYEDCSLPCGMINDLRIKLENQSFETYTGTQASCFWTGRGSFCVEVELTVVGEFWKLTIMDREGCILAVLRKPVADFNCCGPNPDGWILDPSSDCRLSVDLEPDPCTCCPGGPVCPPDGEIICKSTDCCLEDCSCALTMTVTGLFTPTFSPCSIFDDPCFTIDGDPCPAPVGDPGRLACFTEAPTPEKSCGGMNGVYPLNWVGDCQWKFSGTPSGGSTKISSTLTLSGRDWIFRIEGEDGQLAVFTLEDWDCGASVILDYQGGTCPTHYPTDPFATFNLCINVN